MRVCFYISFSVTLLFLSIRTDRFWDWDMIQFIEIRACSFRAVTNIDSLNVIRVLNIISVFIVKRFKR